MSNGLNICVKVCWVHSTCVDMGEHKVKTFIYKVTNIIMNNRSYDKFVNMVIQSLHDQKPN
jgi:hypothetical protein